MVVKRKKNLRMTEKMHVAEDEVCLIEGKGSTHSAGKEKGRYWHISLNSIRVGRAYIKESSTTSGATITVEINIPYRGRGIGTIVFRRACEISHYDEVFANIRKGNKASCIAVERAGFLAYEHYEGKQICMVWRRTLKEHGGA